MRRILLLVPVLAALAASPCAAEKRVTRTARLAPRENAEVTIVSPCGSVSVRTAPGDEVRVDATITDEAVGLDLVSGSDGESVVVSLTGSPSSPRGCAQLEVTVPAACSIRVYGTTEPVEIEGASETRIIDASSREGNVRVTGTAMAVSAASFSGSVVVEGNFAAVTARTATGYITVAGNIGEVNTDTLSGLTQITSRDLARGTAKSVSGSISLKCAFRDPAPLNSLSAETGAGEIWLWVPPGLKARYELGLGSRRSGDPSDSLDISPSILASSPSMTVTGYSQVTVWSSATVGAAVTDSKPEYGPSSVSFPTGSDQTRISLRTTEGTIAIKQWEEYR